MATCNKKFVDKNEIRKFTKDVEMQVKLMQDAHGKNNEGRS